MKIGNFKGCDTFGPKHIWSPDIWSSTIGPPLISSLWTKSPQPILSPWTDGPKDRLSLEYFVCLGGQAVIIWKYGDQIGWGPFVREDQI